MTIGSAADGFDPEYFREVIQNSGIDRIARAAQQEIARTLQPAMVAIQAQQLQVAKLNESIQPTIQQISQQAVENLRPALLRMSEVLSTEIAVSIDYDGLRKAFTALAQSVSQVGVTDRKPETGSPFDSLTDEDLESLVEETWAAHPDLLEEVEKDPEYLKVSDSAKLAMKVSAALALVFFVLVMAGVIYENDEWARTLEILLVAGGIAELTKSTGVAFQYFNRKFGGAPEKSADPGTD